MEHHPMPKDINALCPNCNTKFGYVVENGRIVCPICRTEQQLPVIKIGDMDFYCLDCEASFASTDREPKCPWCHKVWQKISSG